ncbi:MAG: hypothetical protein KatS3mg044_0128 [Rhodothermaceae bacterium]|nr:MAG: hypothetical protein KatS3mg044_0128 [Rhodothermaceae bacterium]
MKLSGLSCPLKRLAILSLLLLSACDLPTSAPDFSFSPDVRAPLIFDKTFVFLGPDAQGREALIDTTDDTFSGVFDVDGSDHSVYIVQNVNDFNLGDLDEVLPEVDVAPVGLSVSIGELGTQAFSAGYTNELGVFTLSPDDPALPPELSSEVPVVPAPGETTTDVTVPNFLVPPKVDLVSLENVRLRAVRFTTETDGMNAFVLELINDRPETLTSAQDAGRPASVTLLQDGNVVGTGSFGFVASGSRATTRISVAGERLTASDLTYRLDVGANGSTAPLTADPGSVRLRTLLEPLRYGETEVESVPAQPDMDVSSSELDVTAKDVTFTGMVTRTGQATLRVTNTLPFPVRLDVIEARNVDAVAEFPAGSLLFSAPGPLVPAGETVAVPLDLGGTPIGTRLTMNVQASSDGTTVPATLTASQGLSFTFDGEVEIERLLFQPQAETFTSRGSIDLDIDEVEFSSDQDFVTLKKGTLRIADLINGMDLTLERVDISIPGLRRPPYRPEDSLVICFQGLQDQPSANKFRRLERQEGPRQVAIDLKDVRVYPTGNRLTYYIHATSETTSATRELTASDQIQANLQVVDLQPTEVAGYVKPFSVAVTPDANDDGRLDVLDDAEAEVSTLDDLADLAAEDFEGLQLKGSAFTFTIRTNVTTDLDLYAVLVGLTPDGEQVFLSGRGEHAVPPTDTLADDFLLGGVPARPEQLIHFRIEGASTPGKTVTRTVILNAENSNVDDFISALPDRIRYAGKAIVQAGGGHAILAEPFEFEAAIGATVPLQLAGDVTFRKEVDADLSDVNDLTAPEKDLRVEEATLRLQYANGLPLGLKARLEVLDELGEVVTVLPAETAAPLRLDAATTGDDGTAAEPRNGLAELTLDENQLRALARGRQIRLQLDLETAPERETIRLRASDTVRLSLQGNFRFQVDIGTR